MVPYALVALGLRFIIARVFFLSGQAKIDGPAIPISLFAATAISRSSFRPRSRPRPSTLFQTQYAALPLPPTVAAYLFTYAEFVLPICLVLGFATRLSALALLVMTVLIQVYVAARRVLDLACLLDRDPDGADVGRSGRDLGRCADPPRLPEIADRRVFENGARFVAALWRTCPNFGICPA